MQKICSVPECCRKITAIFTIYFPGFLFLHLMLCFAYPTALGTAALNATGCLRIQVHMLPSPIA